MKTKKEKDRGIRVLEWFHSPAAPCRPRPLAGSPSKPQVRKATDVADDTDAKDSFFRLLHFQFTHLVNLNTVASASSSVQSVAAIAFSRFTPLPVRATPDQPSSKPAQSPHKLEQPLIKLEESSASPDQWLSRLVQSSHRPAQSLISPAQPSIKPEQSSNRAVQSLSRLEKPLNRPNQSLNRPVQSLKTPILPQNGLFRLVSHPATRITAGARTPLTRPAGTLSPRRSRGEGRGEGCSFGVFLPLPHALPARNPKAKTGRNPNLCRSRGNEALVSVPPSAFECASSRRHLHLVQL